jgi:hypothetical protein
MGKRSEGHVGHNEGRVTDHKTLTDDEHIHAEDKQKLTSRPRGHSHIPEAAENPALADLKRKRDRNRPE